MENNSSAKDWIDIADDYFAENKSHYDFAIFYLKIEIKYIQN